MTMNSCVPSRWCEIMSDRSASSVAIPPALRIMCASPVFSPQNCSAVSRASIQARIASLRDGGIEMAEFEIAGVGFIGIQHFFGDGHGFSSELCWKTIKEPHEAAQLHRVYAKLRLRLPAAPATIS